jgi:hypothetical protein
MEKPKSQNQVQSNKVLQVIQGKVNFKKSHTKTSLNLFMNRLMISLAGVSQKLQLKLIRRNNRFCSLKRHLFRHHSKILTRKKSMIVKVITVNMVKSALKLRTTWLIQTTRVARKSKGSTIIQFHPMILKAKKCREEARIKKFTVEIRGKGLCLSIRE